MNNKLKRICILSILLASNIAISGFSIPLSLNLEIGFTFIITMYVAANFSLAECITFAVLEDLMTYLLFESSKWPFFIGYTLSAILAILIYYLFLRKKITFLNIVISKTIVDIFINVGLGSLWNKIMYGNAFLYYAATSFVKNIILLPIEIIIFYILYKALEPITNKYLKK